jgi:hypothetical protein
VVQDGSKTRKKTRKSKKKGGEENSARDEDRYIFGVFTHRKRYSFGGAKDRTKRNKKKKRDEGKGSESMERRTSTVILQKKPLEVEGRGIRM